MFKNKFKIILLIFFIAICLTGCSNTKTGIATITKDGKTEEKSYSELNDILEQNNEYYKNHYEGAEIKIIDTVDSIEKNSFEYDIDAYVYRLELSSGWVVYIDQNKNDLSEILKGTKVEIHSYLYDNEYWPVVRGKYSLPEGAKAHYGKAQEITNTTIKIVE